MAEPSGITFDIDIEILLKEIGENIKKNIDVEMTKGAFLAHNEVNKMLNQEISIGKPRPKWNSATQQFRKQPSYFSRRGDAPNTDTGRLVQSMRLVDKHKFKKYVKTDIGYAKYLEPKDKLDRPFLSTAVERITPKLTNMIKTAIITGIK